MPRENNIIRRFSCCLILALTLGTLAQAQPQPDGYRRFFKKPTNSPEFWEAISFEMETGRFDLAAEHLDNWTRLGYNDKDLVDIHRQDGLTPFLRMNLIKEWYTEKSLSFDERKDGRANPIKKKRNDEKLAAWNKRAQEQAATLLKKVTEAVAKDRGNEKSIETYVNNLNASPEERQFAFNRLYDSGELAIPHLLTLLSLKEPEEREPILKAMIRFKPEIVPPLVAALDMSETDRRLDILYVLTNHPTFWERKLVDPVPYLWPLTAESQRSEPLRKIALKILAKFYKRDVDRLPQPWQELTIEAEKYYQRQVRDLLQPQLSLWVWNKAEGKVEKKTFPNEVARKYFINRYAKQALTFRPSYRPAQLVFLSYAIDEGFDLPGHGPMMPGPMGDADPPKADPPKDPPVDPKQQPIGKLKPALKEVLSKLSTDLLMDLLRRGLRARDNKLILAPIKILGERKQVEAAWAGPQGKSLLTEALFYGEPRVEMAAAKSFLSIPGALNVQTREQILEVIRRAIQRELEGGKAPKMMMALTQPTTLAAIETNAPKFGFEPVIADSGKKVVDRILNNADVDVLVLDPNIKDPEFSRVIAQIANDRFAHRTPIFVPAIPNSPRSQTILDRIQVALDEIERIRSLQLRNLTEEEKRILEFRVSKTLKETKDRFEAGRDKRILELQIYVDKLNDHYDEERARRMELLKLLNRDKPNVVILDSRYVTDPFYLADQVRNALVQANFVPLAPAEREEYAEQALQWLVEIAREEGAGFSRLAVNPAQMPKATEDRLQKLQEVLLRAMNSQKLSNEARQHAIEVVSKLPDPDVQRSLIILAMSKSKTPEEVPVRITAIKYLQEHLQTHGFPGARQMQLLKRDVASQVRNPTLNKGVREALALLQGNLTPDNRSNGARLLELNP